jgi:hypothetical protein
MTDVISTPPERSYSEVLGDWIVKYAEHVA